MKLNREQQAVVEANMPLVEFTINKYFKSANVDHDDMKSIGYIALCNAAVKYNPHSGYKFSTYATMSIVNNIRKEFMLMKRKKRGSGYITVSYNKILEDAMDRKTREAVLGYVPDFSNEVINCVLCEPVWKMCPTHKMLSDSPLTVRQIGKREGVTGAALLLRRKKEFEMARSYLTHIGIKDIV